MIAPAELSDWEKIEIDIEAKCAQIDEELRRNRFDQVGFDKLCKERVESDEGYRAFLEAKDMKGVNFPRRSCDYEPDKEWVCSATQLCKWYFRLEKKHPEHYELRMEVESRLRDYAQRKALLLAAEREKPKPFPVSLLVLQVYFESTVGEREYLIRREWRMINGTWGASRVRYVDPDSDDPGEYLEILYMIDQNIAAPDFFEQAVLYFTQISWAKWMKVRAFFRYDPKDSVYEGMYGESEPKAKRVMPCRASTSKW